MGWWMTIALALAQEPLDGSAPACDLDPLAFGEREQYIVSVAPGDQAFSYIGHVGLWIRDRQRDIDHVIEFGAIDSRSQDPLTALLLGSLQCKWRIRTVTSEFENYDRVDRLAVAQRLQMPPAMERAFITRIYGVARNASEDTFLFHWRDRSCASELRDILDEVTDGQLAAQLEGREAPLSSRGEVLRHLGRVSWAWFGWSLFAGAQVDAPLTHWESLFVPRRLSMAAQELTLRWPDGSSRPLVDEVCTIHEGRDHWPPDEPPNRTLPFWVAGLLLGGGLAALGRRQRRVVGALVAAYGLLGGVLGAAGVGLFLVSTLDAYGPNRNWLFINPLTLALLPLGIAWMRGRQPAWGWPVAGLLAALAALGLPLLLVPVLPQADHAAFLGLFLPVLVALAWLSRPVLRAGAPQPGTGTSPPGA